ncbi:MAG: A/G-specific adenine glycosylase [Ruminococcus sp.]|nr:A/G-specific adenine glycosylase [Ruminococcus sp.]
MPKPLDNITQPLIKWFEANKRPLPWREDRDPYHVWISEIMLQQTRIEAVMRYYRRFMEALPDIESLSKVDDDKLMKLWEGLGYYSRARNLKKAAQTITDEYNGIFPSRYSEIITLSGIGEYTAGAIASICFDEKVTAVDGNVLRVISRITGSRKNVLLPETKKDIAKKLQAILPDESGKFNEALMELGEIVCLPNGAPDCAHCPLRENCTACQKDLTAEIPVRVKQLKRKREDKTVFLITDSEGRIAIEKRPDSGLLSGMYQLPNISGYYSIEELYSKLNEWNLSPADIRHHKDAKHVFTHIDWFMRAYRVTAAAPNSRFVWVTLEELNAAYSLPTAFKKLL